MFFFLQTFQLDNCIVESAQSKPQSCIERQKIINSEFFSSETWSIILFDEEMHPLLWDLITFSQCKEYQWNTHNILNFESILFNSSFSQCRWGNWSLWISCILMRREMELYPDHINLDNPYYRHYSNTPQYVYLHTSALNVTVNQI